MLRYILIAVLALALWAPAAMADAGEPYANPTGNPARMPVYYCPVSQVYWHPYESGFIELHSRGIVHSRIIVRRVPVQSQIIVLHRSPTIGFIPHTSIIIGPTIRRPLRIPRRPTIRPAPRRPARVRPRTRTRPRIHRRRARPAPRRELRTRPRTRQPGIRRSPTRRHREGVRSRGRGRGRGLGDVRGRGHGRGRGRGRSGGSRRRR